MGEAAMFMIEVISMIWIVTWYGVMAVFLLTIGLSSMFTGRMRKHAIRGYVNGWTSVIVPNNRACSITLALLRASLTVAIPLTLFSMSLSGAWLTMGYVMIVLLAVTSLIGAWVVVVHSRPSGITDRS